jgi:hypothetical protein
MALVGTALLPAAAPKDWPLRAAESSSATSPARDALDNLRRKFHQENDAVRRAKFFPKLGAALLDELKKEGDEGHYSLAGGLLLEYRDALQATLQALEATGRDAEKHSAGFLQLELYGRQALRQVNDIVRSFPLEERPPFQVVEQDLDQLQQRLIKELFPHGPDPKNGIPLPRGKKPGP